MKLSKLEAHRRGLTEILELKPKKGKVKKFIADLERPNGSITMMEVYRIIDENERGYQLQSPTERETKLLRRKYERGSGKGFAVDYVRSQRD